MEELKEMQSGDRKEADDKNQKRRLKTPDQVKVLEKVYRENNYPGEELKSELAEQLGLTEKQVSGWFCHRRLKDRREKEETLANGRQDHSSGVIQDLGSGLRQDSCGSTKQADHWLGDPREVESRSFHHRTSPAVFIPNGPRNKYAGNLGGMSDASSGSSSHSQEQYYSAGTNLNNGNVPNYLKRDRLDAITDARSMFSMGGYKPSGYLKVKCNTENAAITAVKRQLGRHFRDDGPPLGIEFDSLPPGAFESPTRDASPGSYYAGNPAYSPDTDGLWRSTSVTTRDVAYDPRISSRISSKGVENFGRGNSHDFDDYQAIPNLKHKHSLLNPPRKFSSLDPSSDMEEDSGDYVSGYSRRRNYSLSCKDKEEMGTSAYDQYNETSDKRGPGLVDPSGIYPKNFQGIKKSRIGSMKNRGLVRADKVEIQYYEETTATDYSDHVMKVKTHPLRREIPKMAKRVRTELPLQDYSAGASMQMRQCR